MLLQGRQIGSALQHDFPVAVRSEFANVKCPSMEVMMSWISTIDRLAMTAAFALVVAVVIGAI